MNMTIAALEKERRTKMGEVMSFPETWEEFEKQYGFTDTEQIYTNGSRLIQSFRVEQWLEHLKEKTDEQQGYSEN